MASTKFVKALLLFVLLGLCAPALSSGQKLVGVIFSGNIPYYREMHVAMLKELKQKGTQSTIHLAYNSIDDQNRIIKLYNFPVNKKNSSDFGEYQKCKMLF